MSTDGLLQLRWKHVVRGISTHSTGIRAFIVVECAFVIASGGHRDEIFTIRKDNIG